MRLKAKKERKEVRTYTSQQKALWLDFDHSPQSNLFTTKKKMISKLQNLKIKTKKCLNQNKIDLRTFCEKRKKKLPFLYTISSEF